MENKINENEIVCNERFYMDPHSITTLYFENELKKNSIKYDKNEISVLQPYIVFSFFRKDIDIVSEIIDKIQHEEFQQNDFRRKQNILKKKAKRKTMEYRQKRFAVCILLLICAMLIFRLYYNEFPLVPANKSWN